MRTTLALILLIGMSLGLAACGQKGDLYLPDPASKAQAAHEGMAEKPAR